MDDSPTSDAGAQDFRPRSFRDLPSFRLHILSALSEQHVDLLNQRHFGLRTAECRIIGVVGAFGPIQFKQMCLMAELEKSQASRLSQKLAERGVLERLDDPSDQRSFLLRLTTAGRTLQQEILAHSVARNQRWIGVLDAQEQRQFREYLDRLIDHTRLLLEADGTQTPGAAPASTAMGESSHEPPSTVLLDKQLAARLYSLLGDVLKRNDP